MKKIVSLILVLCLIVSCCFTSFSLESKAQIYSDVFSFSPIGSYDAETIKLMLDEYESLTGSDTLNNINETFGAQVKEVDVYVKNVESLNDIYGIQFNVSVDSKHVVLAYAKTDLQSGSKVGYSTWGAYLSHQGSGYKNAIYLSYGSAPLTSDVNKSVNKVGDDVYKIATLYLIIGNDAVEDFSITYELTDVAAKNDIKKVVSIADDFESKTITNADFNLVAKELSVSMLGAQIRTAAPQGIRFGAKLLKDSFYNDCSKVTYGILIAVEQQVDDFNDLTVDNKEITKIDCKNTVYEDADDYIIFTGQVTNFPKTGKYDGVNYIARAYVKFKRANSDKYEIVYTDGIIRNVEQIKSMLGMNTEG